MSENMELGTEQNALEENSYNFEITVKTELKEEDDDEYNAMALLELTTCVQSNSEPIEFNSTDAMINPKTELMVCLHCLIELDENSLSEHMINVHNYRKIHFKCQICSSIFPERQLLCVHQKECRPPQKRHKRKSFSQIMKEVDKSENMEDFSDSDVASCPICLVEIAKNKLKDHLITEHRGPELSLCCHICKRNFKSKLTLREHVKLVHDAIENSEQCELCGQKFSSQKYLSNHKRNVHPRGDVVHQCPECPKRFKSRLCLHQHTKHVHPRGAALPCPLCPHKSFKCAVNLHQHMRLTHRITSTANTSTTISSSPSTS